MNKFIKAIISGGIPGIHLKYVIGNPSLSNMLSAGYIVIIDDYALATQKFIDEVLKDEGLLIEDEIRCRHICVCKNKHQCRYLLGHKGGCLFKCK